MRFRKLRIAWSAVWGLACVLLIVLWVRSYQMEDSYFVDAYTSVGSNSGTVFLYHSNLATYPGDPDRRIYSGPATDAHKPFIWESFGFGPGSGTFFSLPYWFMLLIVAATAAAPWLRWRFSLRTLLIATTLVAVVLGIIVWMSQTG